MRKLLSVVTLSATVMLIAAPVPAGSATGSRTSPSACDHIGDKDAAIRDFVEGIKKDWKLDVNARNYEIQAHGAECAIQPKGARPITSGTEARSGGSTTSMTTVETMPTSATPADGGATIQQDVDWQEPSCYEWEDAEHIGWMRACGQWGRMDYEAATRKNYAFRMYASCHALAGHPFDQVNGCYVAAEPFANDRNIVWNDWDPKATLQFNPCGSLPIGLTVGPFSTSFTITSCDKIVPSDSPRPGVPDLRATWIGKSYYEEDVRQTAALVAFGVPKSYQSSPSILFQRGFTHEECVWPPTPSPTFPWCAI
ncbi:hypothetical protein ACIBQX_41780 [Nonomuraea sp. NPDC049714]|uniref:hypothetical protein n=1 Tax=Nonomuraea sp. NPDC049714 TaxID=3364357 RepID=UPI0037B7E742